jgi:hypothetical protein
MPRHPQPEEDNTSCTDKASDLCDSDTLEVRIGKAIITHEKLVSVGKKPNMAEIARCYQVSDNYHTFRNRLLRKHAPASQAHHHQQLLSKVEEDVLIDWCEYLSARGTPLNRKTIGRRVHGISGVFPGKAWIDRFLDRHPTLKNVRATGLDPVRAQAFNPTTVKANFEAFKKELLDKGVKNRKYLQYGRERHSVVWGPKNSQRKVPVPPKSPTKVSYCAR